MKLYIHTSIHGNYADLDTCKLYITDTSGNIVEFPTWTPTLNDILEYMRPADTLETLDFLFSR